MQTIFPPKLNKGDTIGIISPSNPITDELQDQFKNGIKMLQSLGFKTKLALNVFAHSLGYSASAEEKAADINGMFSDKEVKAIFCSQGGENANSVLPFLNYTGIAKTPKIFLGISDITVLLDGIYAKTGLVTFHADDVMWGLGRNPQQYNLDELIARLVDGKKGIVNKHSQWRMIRAGISEGRLLGGNLRCVTKLIGTDYLPDFTDAILFLEEYGEKSEPTNASCCFHHLDQAGIFNHVQGLLLGYYKTPTGEKIEDIAEEIVGKYDFPIIQCDDFGHNTPNMVLPVGIKVKLDADHSNLELLECAVV